jgi:hypothetical protein
VRSFSCAPLTGSPAQFSSLRAGAVPRGRTFRLCNLRRQLPVDPASLCLSDRCLEALKARDRRVSLGFSLTMDAPRPPQFEPSWEDSMVRLILCLPSARMTNNNRSSVCYIRARSSPSSTLPLKTCVLRCHHATLSNMDNRRGSPSIIRLPRLSQSRHLSQVLSSSMKRSAFGASKKTCRLCA